MCLHYHALRIILPPLLLHRQRHPCGLRESLVHAPILHGRALQIPQRTDPPRNLETLVVGDHILLLPLLCARRLALLLGAVLAEVAFQRNEHELDALAVLGDLADPFRFDVLERVFRVDAEAEHDGVRVVVGERAESVEFFLAGGVPEREFDVDIVHEDV